MDTQRLGRGLQRQGLATSTISRRRMLHATRSHAGLMQHVVQVGACLPRLLFACIRLRLQASQLVSKSLYSICSTDNDPWDSVACSGYCTAARAVDAPLMLLHCFVAPDCCIAAQRRVLCCSPSLPTRSHTRAVPLSHQFKSSNASLL